MDSIWLLLLLQVVLIFLNAIFASAEIAVLSINETKLQRMAKDGNGKAKRLFRLTREPAKFLATIQVAITLSGFLGSAFAAENFSEPLIEFVLKLGLRIPRSVLETASLILITGILSYFTLIFGELVPKRLAMKKSEQIAMGISGVLSGVAFLFRPIVWFLSVSTNFVLRLFGIDPNAPEDEVSEEEIRMMVDVGSEKGTIEEQEKDLIRNVFEFNDITAGEIGVHRTEAVMLDIEDTIEEWENTINTERHTLYPVFADSVDNIIGILNAKDYFSLKEKTRDSILSHAVHPAYFVPENIKLSVLFRNMKQTRNVMAVVLDEYGGVEGIVTQQDLLEELVGELVENEQDENSPDPHIVKLDDQSYEIHGNITLQELSEELGITFTEDCDTFTGLVFSALSTIPSDGKQNITVELKEISVTVCEIQSHQIELALLKRKVKQEE